MNNNNKEILDHINFFLKVFPPSGDAPQFPLEMAPLMVHKPPYGESDWISSSIVYHESLPDGFYSPEIVHSLVMTWIGELYWYCVGRFAGLEEPGGCPITLHPYVYPEIEWKQDLYVPWMLILLRTIRNAYE